MTKKRKGQYVARLGVPPTRYQRTKILGAIECLKGLLSHSQAHLIEINQSVVENYLRATEEGYLTEFRSA